MSSFLERANKELEKEVTGFSEEAMRAMENYDWPGNLRELQNIVKRTVLLSQESTINIDLLPVEITAFKGDDSKQDYSLFKNANEQELILDALEEANGNKSKAARILNVDRKTLYNKLKQYDIKL